MVSKLPAVGLRLPPNVKEALHRAAAEARRPAATLVSLICEAWLIEHNI
jgi:hypothetical protein